VIVFAEREPHGVTIELCSGLPGTNDAAPSRHL